MLPSTVASMRMAKPRQAGKEISLGLVTFIRALDVLVDSSRVDKDVVERNGSVIVAVISNE